VTTARYHRLGDIDFISTLFHTASTITFDDAGTRVYVRLPVSGHLESRYRGIELIVAPHAAAVYQPGGGPVRGRWAEGTRTLGINLPRESIMSAPANLLGEPRASEARFDLAMNTADARVRNRVEFVTHVNRSLAAPGDLLTQPLMAAPLAESIVTSFLLTVPRPHSATLDRPPPTPRPAAIRTALKSTHLIAKGPRETT
jgi:hypothetical protein